MIPLILCLLSFPFEDDTKLNPYAEGEGEYRTACPSSTHHCLLDPPWKRVQPSPGLFAFTLSGGGGNNSSLRFPDFLLGGKAGGFWEQTP